MLWEVQLQPRNDVELQRVRAGYDLLAGHQADLPAAADLLLATSAGYLLEGDLSPAEMDRLADELLVDPLVEDRHIRPLGSVAAPDEDFVWTVLLKPGVMDPVAQSVQEAARDLGLELLSVRTFRRYRLASAVDHDPEGRRLLHKTLANDAIEQIIEGPLHLDHLTLGRPYAFRLITVPLRDQDDAGLMRLSREGQLALNLAEMRAIRDHFRTLDRDPTDAELETLAQTWSEHCSHKTLKGKIDFDGRRINNLLKETIFGATQEIRRRLGTDDWCVSVFEDNAGVVRFDDDFNVCFKVETHNHPSALEPYGGANTGLGGVIRDPLGTGLGAKPICNTDVFCFAPPVLEPGETLPPGVLHPARVMAGVVAGVRDYGNRAGIPTVNGAVCFDARYLGNPLVYCGTVGLIPVDRCRKEPRAGDLIVAVGGRTGRDGIHGATFSSIELTSESEQTSGGAVQIGNAITEKKMLDVLLRARDQKLYHAITDCGAGGFSSAVGEMGEKLGARVDLDKAPLKYEGLSYTEIWISEAQERMVLAVPPENWDELRWLCDSEDVEATALGTFEATGRLRLFYQGHQVADLAMDFLHDGRPDVVRQATRPAPEQDAKPQAAEVGRLRLSETIPHDENYTDTLLRILSSWNVCSKEWIIRQYDHEVQGGTVLKPLVGVANDGPGDAAVITPVLGRWTGLAIGCGLNPHYGDLDPYRMAAAAIDEAVRNVVAVGADPARIALLDNFCWGNTDRPEVLGSLVMAAEACRDLALAYRMPFISGKDSLKNEFHAGEYHIIIPPTLLISALGRVPDVRQCVTMDLKEPGNELFLIGVTHHEMGGSHYNLVHRRQGGMVPCPDLSQAPLIFDKMYQVISEGLVRSCHDLSEGGLAVALAEMAFAGGVGAEVSLRRFADASVDRNQEPAPVLLFSETTTRFLVEVAPAQLEAFRQEMAGMPLVSLGVTIAEPRLRIEGENGQALIDAALTDLKEAWQQPLRR
jgi:phosphoribosylformylglycinamidine synthase